jgi:hypothetical protein
MTKTIKGPAQEPITINSVEEFKETFGAPDNSKFVWPAPLAEALRRFKEQWLPDPKPDLKVVEDDDDL